MNLEKYDMIPLRVVLGLSRIIHLIIMILNKTYHLEGIGKGYNDASSSNYLRISRFIALFDVDKCNTEMHYRRKANMRPRLCAGFG